jgi:hypothetical protein
MFGKQAFYRLSHSTSGDYHFDGDYTKSLNLIVYEGYFNYSLSFNVWAQDGFPILCLPQFLSSKVYYFHCKNLLPLGLNLFLYIFFCIINSTSFLDFPVLISLSKATHIGIYVWIDR